VTDRPHASGHPAAFGLQVPPYGGDTLFTNLVTAYRHLSPALQALADGCGHAISSGATTATSTTRQCTRNARAEPRVADHPVVRVLPETGERALFVNPGFTRRILGGEDVPGVREARAQAPRRDNAGVAGRHGQPAATALYR